MIRHEIDEHDCVQTLLEENKKLKEVNKNLEITKNGVSAELSKVN
jgi:hypothetical protein